MMHTTFWVMCDGPHRQDDVPVVNAPQDGKHETLESATEFFKAAGWKLVGCWKWLCPTCVAQDEETTT